MFEKYQLTALAVILSLGLIFAVKTGTSNMSRDNVSVTGSAYEVVKSDSARFEFNINVRAANKTIAYKTAQNQLPIVLKYLEDNNITDVEVKAYNGYNSYKITPNGMSTNEIAYYNLSQPIVVKSTDVEKIKNLSINIQSLLDKGIDINVMPPEYYYSKLADIKIKLLKDATTDAKDRASAMLQATHNKPGKIQSVQMGVFQITPVDSTNVSDMGINDTSTIDKKVTAVANVVFRVK